MSEFCLDGGYIAGTEVPLPDDPRVRYQISNQLIACNRLFCDRCQIFVRAFSGFLREFPPSLHIDSLELYETRDPDASPYLRRRDAERHRVYCCRHTSLTTAGFNDAYDRESAWRCAGHPPPA